ncbi:MAG: lipopolysaccharide biosynthesis protein [Acidobacteriota bacterium]
MSAENSELGAATGRAAMWAFASMMGARLVTLVGLTLLARLLAPREFGLLAFAMAYIVYVETIGDLGTGTALIYWPNRRDDAAQITFLINLSAGVFWCLITLVIAPYVADFFNAPHGTAIVRALSVGFLIKFLGNTHDALTRKDLRFQARAVPEVAMAAVKAGISLLLAWRGFGAWSLVWGHLAGLTASTILFWTVTPWRPSWTFPRDLLRPMLAYGRGIIFVNILSAVQLQTDLAVVGRMLGMTALGLYQLAGKIPEATVTVIVRVASRVLLPAFSRVAASGTHPKEAYLSAARYIGVVTLPITTGLAILARPFVLALFGPKWVAAAPMVTALTILAGIRALGAHPGDVLKATGRVAVVARIETMRAILIVIAALLAARHSAVAVAIAMAVVDGVAMFFSFTVSSRAIHVKFSEIARAYLPSIVAAGCMAAALLTWMQWGPKLSPAPAVLIPVTIGAMVYLAVIAVTDRTLFAEVREVFRLRSRTT